MVRLILGIFATLFLVAGFQNCSPAKFTQAPAGLIEKASESPLQLKSFFSEMERYKPDNWQLSLANWGAMIEVSSLVANAKYDVVVRKSALDSSGLRWSGCQFENMETQLMSDGMEFLPLSNCVIPVEKISLEVSVKDIRGSRVAVERREIAINQLRLHGVSRSLGVRTATLNLLETRKPAFKLEVPNWSGFVELIVKNSSTGLEVCRRTFPVSKDLIWSEDPRVTLFPVNAGAAVGDFAMARSDSNLQNVECRMPEGSYDLVTTFALDSGLTEMAQTRTFSINVTKPIQAISHVFDEASQTWISLGQVSDEISYRSLPTAKLFRTGSASPYDCSLKFRMNRASLAGFNMSQGRILDYGNSYRYHWEVAYSNQVAPYDDAQYVYYVKRVSGCATGVFFIQPYYDSFAGADVSLNEFWVNLR